MTKPGSGNPIMNVYDIENEIVLWFAKNIHKSLHSIIKKGEARTSARAKILSITSREKWGWNV